jgi:hypothetical protein
MMSARRTCGMTLLQLVATLAVIGIGLAVEMKLRDMIWTPAVALRR